MVESPDGAGVRRGPRISDVMLLVVAAALALVWCRAWADSTADFGEYLRFHPEAWPHAGLLAPAFFLRRWAIPVIGPVTLAVLALAFRPPRPTPVELVARQGMLACLIASAVLLAQWAIAVLLGAITGTPIWYYIESTVF